MTQQIPSTEPELAGVRNFRDVGGLPTVDGRRVRYGVLFRSGHLAHATEDDAAFLSSLGLHTVFDFRNAADQKLEGMDVELAGVRNVNLPLSDPADGVEFWKMVRDGELDQLREILSDGKGANRMITAYRRIIKERTAEHSQVLHSLAEDGVPALMHCAAGKDRAGLSIAVTLLAVGVEREAIVADYLESNAKHRRYKVRRSGDDVATAYSPRSWSCSAPLRRTRRVSDGGLRDHRGDVGQRRRVPGAGPRPHPGDPRAVAGAAPRLSRTAAAARLLSRSRTSRYCPAPTAKRK